MNATVVDRGTELSEAVLVCMANEGVEGIVRYLDGGRVPGKSCTRSQIEAARRAGMKWLYLVWETSGGAEIPGFAPGAAYFTKERGLQDAREALAQLRELGLELRDGLLFFAADYDVGEPDALTGYFDGVDEALALAGVPWEVIGDNVGPYGEYDLCAWARDHWKGARRRWQTDAWSRGLVDEGADLYQNENGVWICGTRVDLNIARAPGWALQEEVDMDDTQLLEALRRIYPRGLEELIKPTIRVMAKTDPETRLAIAQAAAAPAVLMPTPAPPRPTTPPPTVIEPRDVDR